MLDPNDLSDINELINEEEETSDEGDFGLATQQVQRISGTLSAADLLEFYGYYKQAKEGTCNTKKPFLGMQARAKWDAWSKLGDMSATEAKSKYVLKLQQVCPDWQPNAKSGDDVRTGWVVQSVLAKEEQDALPVEQWTIYDFVKAGNAARVRELLDAAKPETVNELDELGMGLLHWAADRGDMELAQLLLARGVQVNLQDSAGQTALHYASSLGYVNCLQLLLKHGADMKIKDADGCTASDVASLEAKQVFDEINK